MSSVDIQRKQDEEDEKEEDNGKEKEPEKEAEDDIQRMSWSHGKGLFELKN